MWRIIYKWFWTYEAGLGGGLHKLFQFWILTESPQVIGSW